MARVIGLSGPQGGGKTTLLNGLREKGLFVDDFKVSREVQKHLGWDSLERALDSPRSMTEFQMMIGDVKLAQETQNAKRTDVPIVLVERTFADISAYTQLWAWELAHAGKWTIQQAIKFSMSFTNTCASRQKIYDANIVLPAMPHVVWQADPHRAKREHQEFITDQLDRFFELMNPKTVPVFRITEGSIQGRIDQAHKWIETL